LSASEAPLVNIYDEDYKRIQEVGWEIQQEWNKIAARLNLGNVKETSMMVNGWAMWVEQQFERIGFVVGVDTTPIYGDRPPQVSLLARTEPEEFDHERKAHEVRRSDPK
jgi:hypothetical protein